MNTKEKKSAFPKKLEDMTPRKRVAAQKIFIKKYKYEPLQLG